jgi:hypothetical protein
MQFLRGNTSTTSGAPSGAGSSGHSRAGSIDTGWTKLGVSSDVSPEDGPKKERWELVLDEARPFWQRQINDAPTQAASDALVASFHQYTTALRSAEPSAVQWAERGLLGLRDAHVAAADRSVGALRDAWGFEVPADAVDMYKASELNGSESAARKKDRADAWSRYARKQGLQMRRFNISAYVTNAEMLDGVSLSFLPFLPSPRARWSPSSLACGCRTAACVAGTGEVEGAEGARAKRHSHSPSCMGVAASVGSMDQEV